MLRFGGGGVRGGGSGWSCGGTLFHSILSEGNRIGMDTFSTPTLDKLSRSVRECVVGSWGAGRTLKKKTSEGRGKIQSADRDRYFFQLVD